MRIDILSPKTGVKKSGEAFYKVICEEPLLPEGVKLSGKGRPGPAQTKAPSEKRK